MLGCMLVDNNGMVEHVGMRDCTTVKVRSPAKSVIRRHKGGGVEGEVWISIVDAIGILIKDAIKKGIPASFCAVPAQEADDVIVKLTTSTAPKVSN